MSKPNLLRCKNIVNIATFNVRTLNTINQLIKLSASSAKHNTDIRCMQEHRYYHSELDLNTMILVMDGHLSQYLHVKTLSILPEEE